jgi:hypothetical protein
MKILITLTILLSITFVNSNTTVTAIIPDNITNDLEIYEWDKDILTQSKVLVSQGNGEMFTRRSLDTSQLEIDYKDIDNINHELRIPFASIFYVTLIPYDSGRLMMFMYKKETSIFKLVFNCDAETHLDEFLLTIQNYGNILLRNKYTRIFENLIETVEYKIINLRKIQKNLGKIFNDNEPTSHTGVKTRGDDTDTAKDYRKVEGPGEGVGTIGVEEEVRLKDNAANNETPIKIETEAKPTVDTSDLQIAEQEQLYKDEISRLMNKSELNTDGFDDQAYFYNIIERSAYYIDYYRLISISNAVFQKELENLRNDIRDLDIYCYEVFCIDYLDRIGTIKVLEGQP